MFKKLLYSTIFGLFSAINAVDVIQKASTMTLKDIDISVKEAFVDTENNCYYYEIIGINHGDMPAYCSAHNLPLKTPNEAALFKLHEKYNALVQKSQAEYYAWFTEFNAVALATAGISGYMTYADRTNEAASFVAFIASVALIFGNIIWLGGDESSKLNLAQKYATEMTIEQKKLIVNYQTRTHFYNIGRNRNSTSKTNPAFDTPRTERYVSDVFIVAGWNNMLICLDRPVKQIFYTIIPELHSEYQYRVELSLN